MSNNIKLYRIRNGLSQQQLADMVGLSRQAISCYECGRFNPSISGYKQIAKALNVSPNSLMSAEEKTKLDKLVVHNRIAVYGQISAGFPAYADEDIEEYLWTNIEKPEGLFALKIKGDSMNMACLPNGAYAIIRQQSIVDDGEIAVVLVGDNDATIKYFFHKGNFVTLRPCSTDPEYKDQIYDITETDIKIIGKVVGFQGVFHA